MINYKEIKNLSCPLCGIKSKITWNKLYGTICIDHTFVYDKHNKHLVSHKIIYEEYKNSISILEIEIYYGLETYFLTIFYNSKKYLIGKTLNESLFNKQSINTLKFNLSDFNLDININSIINYIDSLICFQ